MPEMDGYEATRKIREKERASLVLQQRIPIVALTAHALQEDETRCLQAGMDDYLTKPILRDRLSKTLDFWIQQSRRQNQS